MAYVLTIAGSNYEPTGTSKVTWSDQSGGETMYASSPTLGTGSSTFKLTTSNIPSDATIQSVILSWTPAYANTSSTYWNGTDTSRSGIYYGSTKLADLGSHGVATTKDCTAAFGINPKSLADITITVKYRRTGKAYSGTGTTTRTSSCIVRNPVLSITYISPCTPPTTVIISPNSTAPGGAATLTWSGAGAGTNNAIAGYLIYRRKYNLNTEWELISTVNSTATSGTYTVYAPNAMGAKYYYKINTKGAAGKDSTASPVRSITAQVSNFTDPTLIAQSTPIKAIHMTELQQRVNGLRDYFNLSPYSFTSIISGTTKLSDWTAHVNQIRTAYDELGSSFSHDNWITISSNCPTAAVIQQMRDIIMRELTENMGATS